MGIYLPVLLGFCDGIAEWQDICLCYLFHLPTSGFGFGFDSAFWGVGRKENHVASLDRFELGGKDGS
jgi:hypothetical protein